MTEGSQGRGLEAGSNAEAMEECCLLTHFACFLIVQDHLPKGSIIHSELGSLTYMQITEAFP